MGIPPLHIEEGVSCPTAIKLVMEMFKVTGDGRLYKRAKIRTIQERENYTVLFMAWKIR